MRAQGIEASAFVPRSVSREPYRCAKCTTNACFWGKGADAMSGDWKNIFIIKEFSSVHGLTC
ncbi:MAG: hypothetical protein LBF66_00485 [Holosporales bacterium]|nr:hypothetical protein [Holosporales bacterium]